jgi:hypothetical protein
MAGINKLSASVRPSVTNRHDRNMRKLKKNFDKLFLGVGIIALIIWCIVLLGAAIGVLVAIKYLLFDELHKINWKNITYDVFVFFIGVYLLIHSVLISKEFARKEIVLWKKIGTYFIAVILIDFIIFALCRDKLEMAGKGCTIILIGTIIGIISRDDNFKW